jgi:hypothetical protein
MRPFITHLAWGLATAALLIGTPLRAAGLPSARATATAPNATAPRDAAPENAVPAIPNAALPVVLDETGGGLGELQCAVCVGAATFALFSGGTSMLPVLLTNTTTVGTIAGACLMACRSVLEDLM